MAKVYMTDGRIVDALPANGEAFTLDELQEIVGGYIEFHALSDGTISCVNEEGKLIPLPINLHATDYFHSMYPAIPGDIIHGNMIVMSPKEAGE